MQHLYGYYLDINVDKLITDIDKCDFVSDGITKKLS